MRGFFVLAEQQCDLFERWANANLAYVLGVIREWCFNPVSESAAHVACA
ncbi:MAG: hypothetical protein G4V63_32065 [Candidatus Afipia apatlaquensis]|uniref:Uncharacterized protein n=1 Tax=Candidatus Afipia apatlaquensis TaxID=2712852 RepID=A0A7C9RLD1_9BRAD|nr:hypothetical protein [Candidatus Afipia apatlaquensis]